MQNYYQILEVSMSATQDEIRTSYIEKIKKYHPDTYKGDKSFAEKQTALITEAYTTLKDDTLRKRYDLKNNFTAKKQKQTKTQTKPFQTTKSKQTQPKNNNIFDDKKNDSSTKPKQTESTPPIKKVHKPLFNEKYTKRQFVQDIFIVILSILLISMLILSIF